MSRNKLMTNYGWVQNTSNLSTVRDTVDLMPNHGITHLELREKIKEFRIAEGDLPNRWTWDARCRIKAIHATGFVKLNRIINGYELTDLGRKLKLAEKSTETYRGKRILSDEEKEIFKEGLLTNPPVIRVLELLNDDRKEGGRGLSKYDIGEKLGFVGDIGFTHLNPSWVVSQGYSFNDKEGDADKWARTILSWLTQVGWVKKSEKQDIDGKELQLHTVIPEVEQILRYDASRISRNVPIEMLCSNHHPFPKLIQKRRSLILELLKKEPQTIGMIINHLEEEDVHTNEEVIEFEIINLKNSGFRIVENGGYYKLCDKIHLDIITIPSTEPETELIDKVEALIQRLVVRYQNSIPSRLVDHIIRFGFDGSKAKEFEGIVSEFFEFLGYDSEYLGQGKGRVTDVLVRYKHPTIYAESFGLIVDAKATSQKYNFPASDKRKMKEYILNHGPILLKEGIPKHAFSFISSDFIENVQPHLEEIKSDTSINGSAIKVDTLLELGHKIRSNELKIENMYNSFICNQVLELT